MAQKLISRAVVLVVLALLVAACRGSSGSPASESTAKPSALPVVSGASTPAPPIGYVMGVSFVDRQHGWAIETLASPGIEPATVGTRIVATSDGGLTWTQQYTTPLTLNHIQFIDLQHGWAAAGQFDHAALLATSDGGATWQKLADLPGAFGIDFVAPDRGWLAYAPGGQSQLGITNDGGRTWTRVSSPCTEPSVHFLSFATPNLGWLVCTSGAGGNFEGKAIFRTDDGGISWREVTRADGKTDATPGALGTPGYVSGVFLLDGSRAWLTYSSPAAQFMARSRDGGHTWEEAPLPQKTVYTWMNDLHFVDADHGWLVAAPANYNPPGQIYATSDGGETWKAVPVRTSIPRPEPVVSAMRLSFSECGTQRDWAQPSLEAVLASPIASTVASPRAYEVAVHDRHIYLVGPGNSVNKGWTVLSGAYLNRDNQIGACPPITATYPVGTKVTVALIDYRPLEVLRSGDALFVRVAALAMGITNLSVDLSSNPPRNLVIYFLTPDDHVILSCQNAGCD